MIFNLPKKNIIACKPCFVYGVIAKIRGMIKRSFSNFDAVVFQNSRGLHTLFPKEDIDVLFVDIENSICKILENAKHWHINFKAKNAVCIVCLPSGNVKQNNIEIEDILDLNAEITRAKKIQFKKIKSLIESAPKTAISNTKTN